MYGFTYKFSKKSCSCSEEKYASVTAPIGGAREGRGVYFQYQRVPTTIPLPTHYHDQQYQGQQQEHQPGRRLLKKAKSDWLNRHFNDSS